MENKKKMKKIILTVTTFILITLFLTNTSLLKKVHAQTSPTPTAPSSINIPPVDEDLLNTLNPLKNYSTKAEQLSTPGGIISEILAYSFPIAGVILFVMLIMAGFKMLTGASNSSSMEEGKKMISTAVIGFIILFAAYWIAQLIEIIFGIRILGVQ